MVARLVSRIRLFFQKDIWQTDVSSLPKWRAFVYRFFRVWVIAITEFGKDKIAEKASALTYFSLLSIVPVAAMAFGIATAFGLEDYLRDELTNFFSGQQEVLDYTVEFAERMLATSSGGLISGIGALFLIYAVARLLHNIEMAFNDIWDTKKGRSLRRKLTDYVSFILLAPLMLIISSATTVFITTSIEGIAENIPFLGFMKPFILFLIQLIPYSLIWFLLFIFYIIFPNVAVKIKAALLAGIMAGTAYQLTQWAWIEGQVFLNRYSVIYGSFAALPLLLIWMQLSWIILLFGAEFAFAIQNEVSWAHDKNEVELNKKARRILSLLVLKKIVRQFEEHDTPLSFVELTRQLAIPHRVIRELVRDLETAKLIIRALSDQEEELYLPGLSVHKLDIYMFYEKMDGSGQDRLEGLAVDDVNEISNVLEAVNESIRKSDANRLIKDL